MPFTSCCQWAKNHFSFCCQKNVALMIFDIQLTSICRNVSTFFPAIQLMLFWPMKILFFFFAIRVECHRNKIGAEYVCFYLVESVVHNHSSTLWSTYTAYYTQSSLFSTQLFFIRIECFLSNSYYFYCYYFAFFSLPSSLSVSHSFMSVVEFFSVQRGFVLFMHASSVEASIEW